MTSKYRAGFNDLKGGLIEARPQKNMVGFSKGTPTASQPGWEKGAIVVDITNGVIYRNDGSTTSATWTKLLGNGDTATTLTVTTLTVTNAVAFAAGTTVGGMFVGANAPVAVPAATTTLTLTQALHGGKVVTLASTGGLAITPPAATGTGNVYLIAVATTISGGSVTVDAKAGNASDVFGGVSAEGSSGGTAGTFGTASNSNLLTLNGSTTGGLKGTLIEMIDIATNVWSIFVSNVCSGSAATPFSNH